MLIFIGIIIGLLVSILIVMTLIFLKHPIQQKLKVIEAQVSNAGPRPQGFIIEPMGDADEARQEIIARNRKQGRDTKLSDLQDE